MRVHGREAAEGFEQEVLAAAPDVDAAMEMVIACLRELEGDRALGFGVVGFLPYRALRAWARDEGLDRELFVMLKAVIQRLDSDRVERDAARRALEAGGRG